MTNVEILDQAPVVAMHLILDEQKTTTSSDACVIHFVSPADPSEQQTLRLIEQSGVLDFWADDAEDIYSVEDGEQI